MIGDPNDCSYCGSDAGSEMWECHHSDKPDSEDAMPCLCLCHLEERNNQ